GRLVAGTIGLVLEGHPPVTGLRQHTHHPRIEIAGSHAPFRETLSLRLRLSMRRTCRRRLRLSRSFSRDPEPPPARTPHRKPLRTGPASWEHRAGRTA